MNTKTLLSLASQLHSPNLDMCHQGTVQSRWPSPEVPDPSSSKTAPHGSSPRRPTSSSAAGTASASYSWKCPRKVPTRAPAPDFHLPKLDPKMTTNQKKTTYKQEPEKIEFQQNWLG